MQLQLSLNFLFPCRSLFRIVLSHKCLASFTCLNGVKRCSSAYVPRRDAVQGIQFLTEPSRPNGSHANFQQPCTKKELLLLSLQDVNLLELVLKMSASLQSCFWDLLCLVGAASARETFNLVLVLSPRRAVVMVSPVSSAQCLGGWP